jgi:hypothetical protein
MSEKKLSTEVIDVVTRALSEYFGNELIVTEYSYERDEEWLYRVKTGWLYNNRGIFARVISRYYIDATIVKHAFDDKSEQYRNGKVYRIYPHLLWEHYTGGTNGHDTEDKCIIIEKSMNEWHISKELK